MNALAYLKGPEFVCHRNFDKFREWIVYGKHAEQFYQLPEMHSPKFSKELIPKLAHFCLFTPVNGRLLATVTLYNSYSQCFVMGDLPELTFSEIDGVICDWSKDDNQVREYTLRSAIFRMCQV